MSEGWIYMVSTPTYSEKGLYKIGRATRISLELCDPGFHKRIGERYPTGGFNLVDMLEPFRELVTD